MGEQARVEGLQPGLAAALAQMAGELAVAVSGGVDSMTLATFAHRLAGGRVTMFHAVSPAVPGDATARVERLAAREGWRLKIVEAGEFSDADYVANPLNRCFFCKTNLYGAIARHSDAQMLSGANLDDLKEYRPGLEAAKQHGVRHPYLEAEIDKAGVRALARALGLGALSELPAAPCLSSRVETGIPIRAEVLRAIHAVEREIAQSFPQATVRCRMRARAIVIELDPATLAAIEGARRDQAYEHAKRVFADIAPAAELSFAVYRNGGAFLHARP